MEERTSRGAWPHPPLQYEDVRAHLVTIIEQEEWFPCDLSSSREGVVIQNTGENFICHSLGYNPLGPQFESRKSQKSFRSATEAADFYLKWDLHLPGDMDSWKVV